MKRAMVILGLLVSITLVLFGCSADKDHNVIWELQDGTIGEAHGLLSKEEGAKFIEEHYGKDAY